MGKRYENLLAKFFFTLEAPPKPKRAGKEIEYIVVDDEGDIDTLAGREWREAKRIASNPPANINRVDRYVWDLETGDREETTLFEREDY
jgi:hypothetical protein